MASSTPPPPPNPTLKGHKLLLVLPQVLESTPEAFLKSLFPDLQVDLHIQPWEGEEISSTPTPTEIWKDVTILLTTNILPTLEQTPNLQYVQLVSAGAGLVVNSPLFLDTDIAFCSANGTHGPQIAEWVVSTYLVFEHRIHRYLEFQREGKWGKISGLVNDAVGRRVGILGYGAIGRQTARVCRALGMEVYAYTNHPRLTPESRRDTTYAPEGLGDPDGTLPSKWFSGQSKQELHDFLGSDLDLLVISTPLTEKTRHLISKPEFDILGKKKTFVSNIGRGPIIDTDALVEALESDVIRGAALDVTDPEPLPEGHPLWTTKNVILTPHVSGNSSAYEKRLFDILVGNLKLFAQGKELRNQISRKDGY
ncbi:D-2-hydroxyacid dehydrogenase [Cladobotryum mycophilum]|uniref:D-2-hydroxyacid dehydrogenase n=1 Tax=Cladobotryum mycophilum TaxID=491253 RepID=A0ABR0SXR4_9HYPO